MEGFLQKGVLEKKALLGEARMKVLSQEVRVEFQSEVLQEKAFLGKS